MARLTKMTNIIIKILLVGDHSIFRTALRMLIETERRLQVVGEISHPNQVAEFISSQNPDLVLLDLPDFGGKDWFPFIKQFVDNVPVLILASQQEADIYQESLKLGISGLVRKDKSGDTLRKAIEKIYDGELWFDRTIMGKTIRQMMNEKQSLIDNPDINSIRSMTEREKQVVELICKGLKNKLIAEKLFVTETTVRHHLTSIFNKLEVTTRLELVIFAFKHNLVKPPNDNESFDEIGGGKIEYDYV